MTPPDYKRLGRDVDPAEDDEGLRSFNAALADVAAGRVTDIELVAALAVARERIARLEHELADARLHIESLGGPYQT